MFKEDIYIPQDENDRIAMLDRTLPKVSVFVGDEQFYHLPFDGRKALKADEILKSLKKSKQLPSAEQSAIIEEVEALREQIIQVAHRYQQSQPFAN